MKKLFFSIILVLGIFSSNAFAKSEIKITSKNGKPLDFHKSIDKIFYKTKNKFCKKNGFEYENKIVTKNGSELFYYNYKYSNNNKVIGDVIIITKLFYKHMDQVTNRLIEINVKNKDIFIRCNTKKPN